MLPVLIWRCKDAIFIANSKCSNYIGSVHAPPNKSIYMIYLH